MKIATINIARISSEERLILLLNYCLTQKFDVVGLQEVAFASCPILENHFQLFAAPGPNKAGTAILVAKHIAVHHSVCDPDGRLISVQFNNVSFVSLYAPSGRVFRDERSAFFRVIVPAFLSSIKRPLILVGDFNAVDGPQDRIRLAGTKPSTPVDHALVALVASLELVDMWKALRPRDLGHTFTHQGGSARIDRIYCSRSIKNSVTDIRLDSTYVTDHSAILAHCSLLSETRKEERPKSCIWKLNVSIVSEDAFSSLFRNFLATVSALPLRRTNVSEWWDSIFKPGVKRIAQSYCRRRARLGREMGRFYQNCLSEMTQPGRELSWPDYQALREEARNWNVRLLQGAKIRSRCTSVTDTDSPSLYHVRKETTRGRLSMISSLSGGNGELIVDDGRINQILTSSFRQVFSQEPSGDAAMETSFLGGIQKVVFSSELSRPVELAEVASTLAKMPLNGSPGEDGLPYDFYQQFWADIGPIFLEMFEAVLRQGRVTESQAMGLIRLVPKSDCPTTVSDYRPIALLNCDYKLMAGTIAHRLKKTLPDVVGPSQCGGVPGRKISDNLSLYRDVIAFIEERHGPCNSSLSTKAVPGVVIGVDFAKAYDLVPRETLWRILHAFGYPEFFIKWIQSLYAGARMAILNGQTVAGTVSCSASLRQGCPLSIHLYVLFLEPLLCRLRHELTGITMFNRKLVTRAFVDDVAIFADSDGDIRHGVQILHDFCQWTNARLNTVKSKALGLGGWAQRTTWPVPWLTSDPTLTLLGISFSHSIQETTNRIWDAALGHLQGILRTNVGRCFSLHQRVHFLKTDAYSRVVFIGQVLPCPPSSAVKLHSATTKFLWAGRLERPQPGAIFRPTTAGGLAMLHTDLFLQALFLRPIAATVLGPDTCGRFLLRYWLAFPTRAFLHCFTDTPAPMSFFQRPAHIETALRSLKALFGNGLSPPSPLTHRKIYSLLLTPEFVPGHMERAQPLLDWEAIWRSARFLPPPIRESQFLFNHRLLFTRDRCHNIDPRVDPICDRCHLEDETAEHLMIGCPVRQELTAWLQSTLQTLGCVGNLSSWIRGDVGQLPYRSPARLLVAVFVDLSWRTRQRRRLLTIAEIQHKWKSSFPGQQFSH
jgi:exonuclease III